jgi:hypothetical protein
MNFNTNQIKKSKLSTQTRHEIALKSLRKEQPISTIATDYGCSRNTVYKQQSVAINAIDQAFNTSTDDDKVLFYVPVSKQTMYTMVVMLHLICRSSFRGIITFLSSMFGFDISIGNVTNIINRASESAEAINKSYDLSKIKTSSSDELFHRNQPILATVDIPSRFCAQADLNNSRDGNAWGVSLLFLEEQKYNPDTVIVDGAKGMAKGYQDVLPKTKIRNDHFHTIRDLKDTARFLRNKAQSALTAAGKSCNRMTNAVDEKLKDKFRVQFELGFTEFSLLAKVSHEFTILSNWMQYDVLQLAGYNPAQRAELFDFILVELEKLANIYPHKIQKILKSLKFQRDKLLDVASTINDKFTALAKKHDIPLSYIWNVCYLARYDYESIKYQQNSAIFEQELGYELYEQIEDEVLLILENTHRCSSIVENFNSRLARFIPESKHITQKMLNLYRFFLNHSPFMRSYHKHLRGVSPAEALTGTKHDPWFKMLGFQTPHIIHV